MLKKVVLILDLILQYHTGGGWRVGKVGFLEKLMPLFYMKAVKIFENFAFEIFSGRIQINYFTDFRLNFSIPHGGEGSRIFGKVNAIILHESGKNIRKFCI